MEGFETLIDPETGLITDTKESEPFPPLEIHCKEKNESLLDPVTGLMNDTEESQPILPSEIHCKERNEPQIDPATGLINETEDSQHIPTSETHCKEKNVEEIDFIQQYCHKKYHLSKRPCPDNSNFLIENVQLLPTDLEKGQK